MLEIQIHPSDLSKPPRYWFLPRPAQRRLLLALVAAGLILTSGLILTPRGVSSLMLWGRLLRLEERVGQEREQLSAAAMRLDELQQQLERARLSARQMELIFGAEGGDSFAGGADALLGEGEGTSDPALALLRARAMALDSETLLIRIDRLEEHVHRQQVLASVVPSVCPLPARSFVLTSPYGTRTSPFTGRSDFHSGIDLAAREGVPVRVAGDGVITFAGRFSVSQNVGLWRLGNSVVVNHGDRYLTIYAHLRDISVSRGDTLRRGDQVGTVGNTGWSTSPHLHYEVRVLSRERGEQTPVDPRIYILDHDWTERESWLVAHRQAPPPPAEPLPSLVRRR